MRLSRSVSRAVYRSGRSIAKDIMKRDRRRRTYHRVQKEAEARPESVRVETSEGEIWMSPIEVKLYEAMRQAGLSPVPQYPIEGYIVDFAFPDVALAIEADGAAYHAEDRRERDRKRDGVIRRHGWTVKRFYGTTIHNKAENCAFVIKREVEGRRTHARLRERQREAERQARWNAVARPFQRIVGFFKRD